MPLPEPVAAVAVERSWGQMGRAAVAQMQGVRSSYEDTHVLSQELGICGVYDGHNGEEAAGFVAARLHRHVAAAGRPSPHALQAAFVACDQEMCGKLPQGSDSGTTATLAVVHEDGGPDQLRVWVANSGDSRAVLWHCDTDTIEETRDHTPSDPNERARIESAGGYVFDEWEPPRVDGELACSRALGDYRFKRNRDIPPGNQKVSPVPDVYEWRARRGDWLIVACDGVWDTFRTEQVVDRLCKTNKDAEPGSKLAMFLMFCIEKHADDNLTLAVVELGAARTLAPVLSVMPFGFLRATDDEVLEQYDAFCRRFGRSLERQTTRVKDGPKAVTSMQAVPPTKGSTAFARHLAWPLPPQQVVQMPLQLPLEEVRKARAVTCEGGELSRGRGGPGGGFLFGCCGGRAPVEEESTEAAAWSARQGSLDSEVTEPLLAEAEAPRDAPRRDGGASLFSRFRQTGPAAGPVDCGGFTEGSRVEAEFDGFWYPGTVVKLPNRPGGDFAVQCDQDPEGQLTLTHMLRPGGEAPVSSEPAVGSLVEVFYNGSWLPGTLVTAPKDRFDVWVVQRDVDPEGELTYGDQVRPLR